MAIEAMIDQFGALSARGPWGINRHYSDGAAIAYKIMPDQSYAGATGSPGTDPGIGDPQGHVNFVYPVPDDCSGLMITKELLINEIYHANQMIAAGEGAKSTRPWIEAFQARLLEVTNKIASMQCVQTQEQAQAAQDQATTLSALAEATTPVSNPTDNTNKYIIWGIGGLMIAGAIVIFLKKK